MKILLDNGHGIETPGKRSPDGTVREYEYCRRLARAIQYELERDGYDATLVTPEKEDISITQRVRRVNEYCKLHGNKRCLLVSIHLNAMGSGAQWMDARGWSVHVSLNASYNSKLLAGELFDEASKHFKVRKPSWSKKYWEQNLGICRDSFCPAVLTENLFQDNIDDVLLLKDEDTFLRLVRLHVNAIKEYIKLV